MPTVRRDRLKGEVLTGLRERLMNPALFQVFAREFTLEWNRLRAEAVGERHRCTADWTRLTGEIECLVNAVAAGKSPSAVLARQRERLLT